jgi:hypothetical protein
MTSSRIRLILGELAPPVSYRPANPCGQPIASFNWPAISPLYAAPSRLVKPLNPARSPLQEWLITSTHPLHRPSPARLGIAGFAKRGRQCVGRKIRRLFQAIEIDGEPYWDGGYSGNPTITPLIRECKSQDTILVQINPIERKGSPRSASEILNRLNEVSFNAVLLKELRMMALLRQVADPGNSEGAQWAGMRIHRIGSEMLTELGASSKLNAEWEFFTLLHDEGRRAAQMFLETHAMDLGSRSTLDIDSLLEQV